jgi:CspA family cold shock protein
MSNGTVIRVVRDKGFGFIRDDRGQELFFHRTAVDGDFNRLNEGQSVVFEEEPSPKGPRAGAVRPKD